MVVALVLPGAAADAVSSETLAKHRGESIPRLVIRDRR